jgi:hypothetical protein
VDLSASKPITVHTRDKHNYRTDNWQLTPEGVVFDTWDERLLVPWSNLSRIVTERPKDA